MLDAALAVPGVEVIGVCDAYKGRVTRALERLGGKAKDYGDYRALLADKSIDAVIIATPDHWHKQHDARGVRRGQGRLPREADDLLTIDEGPEMYAAAEKSGRILQIGSQGISSKLQQTAKEIIKSGKLGQISLVRASYDRNSDSGAWLYPIPPDADPKTVNWDMFLGPAPKQAVQPRALLPLALLLGLLRRHLDRPLRPPDDDHPLRDGRDRPRDGGGDGRQLPAPEDARGAGHAQRLRRLRQGELHASPSSGTFNSASAGESGFAILGNEGSLVFRGDRMTFTPEHIVEGNGWIVVVLAVGPREGLLGRPRGAEAGDAGHLAVADAEPGRVVDGGRPRLDPASTWPASSTRCARASPSVEDGRAGPPRGGGRAHGERVDQAEGAGQLGLREGRPEEGLSPTRGRRSPGRSPSAGRPAGECSHDDEPSGLPRHLRGRRGPRPRRPDPAGAERSDGHDPHRPRADRRRPRWA